METEQKDLHKEFVQLLKERFELRVPFWLGNMGLKELIIYPHEKGWIYERFFPKEIKEARGMTMRAFDNACTEAIERWESHKEEEEEIEMSESMPSNKKSSKSSKLSDEEEEVEDEEESDQGEQCEFEHMFESNIDWKVIDDVQAFYKSIDWVRFNSVRIKTFMYLVFLRSLRSR